MNNTEAYLSLLEKVLIDYYRCGHDEYRPITWGKPNWRKRIIFLFEKVLRLKGYAICKCLIPDSRKRLVGADWPFGADTMIGLKRLQNIRFCLEDTIRNQIEGDLIETGVWRGGATIYMRALLKAHGITNKKVWVADSFEGLPKPDPKKYAEDEGDLHFEEKLLSISLDEVKGNFAKYDLLDDQVVFLKGWFKDTLPTAPIGRLSILRLDGDMYESTIDSLVNLYPKLSSGGYIIIDDWGAVKACRRAVEDYRKQNGITEEILPIDWAGVFWRKT